MAARTLKIDISFQELLSVVDQLELDEKMFLKKKLDSDNVSTWQERFGKATRHLGKRNKKIPAKEVLSDVERAVSEVRGNA